MFEFLESNYTFHEVTSRGCSPWTTSIEIVARLLRVASGKSTNVAWNAKNYRHCFIYSTYYSLYGWTNVPLRERSDVTFKV